MIMGYCFCIVNCYNFSLQIISKHFKFLDFIQRNLEDKLVKEALHKVC